MDSADELDELRAEKKQAKSDIRMISACVSENLYTAFGYVDEMEKLDYGAEDVLPTMYDYHKRDIAEEFNIVESTDRVVVDTAKTEEDAVGISEDCRVVEAVFADISTDNMIEKLITEQSLYEDVAENGRIGIDVSITDDDIVETAELMVDEQAEQIATTIQKYYKSYDYLSVENKARLFNFRIDDNSYNLQLHAGVLRKLGIHRYGSDGFEDYQSIYGETMKRVEKPNSECERRYYNKEWEREKGR